MALAKKNAHERARLYLLERGIDTPPAGLNRMFLHALRELEPYPSTDATEALTEGEVLALQRGGIDLRRKSGEPDLVAQGRAQYAALLERSLSPEQVAERLGVTPGRVRQLLGERKLLGVAVEGRVRIPDFQLVPVRSTEVREGTNRAARRRSHRVFPGLDQVVAALPPGTHLLTVHRWLTAPQRELRVAGPDPESPVELSPLQWLEQGRPPGAVARLAQGLTF